jgi:hypothetical protein
VSGLSGQVAAVIARHFRGQAMDAVTRLRTLRRARYACEHRDRAGRKCLAPASLVVQGNDKPEAHCIDCAEGGTPSR